MRLADDIEGFSDESSLSCVRFLKATLNALDDYSSIDHIEHGLIGHGILNNQ